jgi:hypothetical protein
MPVKCSICLDLLELNNQLAVTKCGHLFHHSCVSRWVSLKSSCPYCRVALTSSQVTKAYVGESDQQGGAAVDMHRHHVSKLCDHIKVLGQVIHLQLKTHRKLKRKVRFSRKRGFLKLAVN